MWELTLYYIPKRLPTKNLSFLQEFRYLNLPIEDQIKLFLNELPNIYKSKDTRKISVDSALRQLNLLLKQNMYQVPCIEDMIRSRIGLTALDLSLLPYAQSSVQFYSHKRKVESLPMGTTVTAHISQSLTSKLFKA